MKARIEARGLHLYDRVTGLHVLDDAVRALSAECSVGPAVVSIALTNTCDLNCTFCYAPKVAAALPAERVFQWCCELDAMGTLEVAFGGGEPTLHPDLADICRRVWECTGLGVSITTNGHHLTDKLVRQLAGKVSIVRFSIDAVEPLYREIRNRPLKPVLDWLRALSGEMHTGVNVVVNTRTLRTLDTLYDVVKDAKTSDVLLLPQVADGSFVLTEEDWRQLEKWVNAHWRDGHISVTAAARPHIECPFLFDVEPPNAYAHITADGRLGRSSYSGADIVLGRRALTDALGQLHGAESA